MNNNFGLFFTAILIIFLGLGMWFFIIFNQNDMKIFSSVFNHTASIPVKYTCQGENISPPLSFSDVPIEAESLALVVTDPDAPVGTWVHWLVWNISADTSDINENSVPLGAMVGLNTAKTNKYIGPCPPTGSHRYFFKLYALDIKLKLPSNSNLDDFERGIMGHILEEAELVGNYQNQK